MWGGGGTQPRPPFWTQLAPGSQAGTLFKPGRGRRLARGSEAHLMPLHGSMPRAKVPMPRAKGARCAISRWCLAPEGSESCHFGSSWVLDPPYQSA